MLEIEEEDRYDFGELLDEVIPLISPPPSRPSLSMLNSNGSQRNLELSRGNRKQNGMSNRTPKNAERGMYRNDVSPFRGRFGGTVKNNQGIDRSRKTYDRPHESRSPMRRQQQQQQKGRQDFQSLHQRASPFHRN